MSHPHWPLFDLVVRTPRLELRLAREHEFVELTEVADAGIHDPATMPFTEPWTDEPLPDRHRHSYQWWWRQRAEWRPEAWAFDGAVFHEGRIIGVQSLMAEKFASLRAVSTGSWLGRAHQGKGYGKEMRAAILHLAFEGLGAEVAYSGAFADNTASIRTSQSLGYRENGREVHLRRGQPAEIVNLRLDRADWEAQGARQPDCAIEGLGTCLEMFGVGAGGPEPGRR